MIRSKTSRLDCWNRRHQRPGRDEDLGEWYDLIDATYGLDDTLEYLTGSSLAGDTGLTVGVAPGLPGDFNDDGRVDAADYIVWRDRGLRGRVPTQ